VNPDEKGWLVELSGCETINNRRIERWGQKDVMVFGKAHIYYALAADVRLKLVKGKWEYGSGRIIRAAITGHDGAYTPPQVHKIKRIYCSDTASISRMAGRSIGGALEDPDTLKLAWPVPKDFREPAVIFVKDVTGHEEEAAFVSDHFLDYASAFELKLRAGVQSFKHGFEGAMDKAFATYEFKLHSTP
jgi:hypothetical protein